MFGGGRGGGVARLEPGREFAVLQVGGDGARNRDVGNGDKSREQIRELLRK